MINSLKKIIKSMDGQVLAVGLKEEKILDLIVNNKKIKGCFLLDSNLIKGSGSGKEEKIFFSELSKKLGKKKTDYIIADINSIKKELRHFVRNSIDINSKKMYVYGNINDIELDEFKNYYERYKCNIQTIIDKDDFILEIDNTNIKTPFIKDVIFYIKDVATDLVNNATELIMK